jgi:TIR domain
VVLPAISEEATNRNALLARAVDWIFGYDFFLSYNHGDGMRLPRRLKERLEQAGFRVFIDQTEYVAGEDLRRETRRQVVKSRKIVVIGRPGALRSVWVKREVDVALSDGKIPVILDVNGAVEAAPQDAALATMARERHWLRLNETLDDPDSEPTDNAVSELVRGFKHTRQEVKRQRILATAVAVLAIAAGVAIWQAVEATRAKIVAEAQRDRAQRVLDQVVATNNRRVQSLSMRVQTQARADSIGLAPSMHVSEDLGIATQSPLDRANALITQGSILLEKGEIKNAHWALATALDILVPGSQTSSEDGKVQLARFSAYDRLAGVAARSHDPAIEITALTNCLALAENQAGAEHVTCGSANGGNAMPRAM